MQWYKGMKPNLVLERYSERVKQAADHFDEHRLCKRDWTRLAERQEIVNTLDFGFRGTNIKKYFQEILHDRRHI